MYIFCRYYKNFYILVSFWWGHLKQRVKEPDTDLVYSLVIVILFRSWHLLPFFKFTSNRQHSEFVRVRYSIARGVSCTDKPLIRAVLRPQSCCITPVMDGFRMYLMLVKNRTAMVSSRQANIAALAWLLLLLLVVCYHGDRAMRYRRLTLTCLTLAGLAAFLQFVIVRCWPSAP